MKTQDFNLPILEPGKGNMFVMSVEYDFLGYEKRTKQLAIFATIDDLNKFINDAKSIASAMSKNPPGPIDEVLYQEKHILLPWLMRVDSNWELKIDVLPSFSD